MPTRLQLKQGVGPQAATTVLRELVMAARNVPSASGGGRSSALRDAYLNWAETAESQLSALTHDVALVTMLQTPRFWQIRALDEPSTRPWPLVDAEIRLQTTVLERLADDLDERVRRLGSAAGHLTVLDTNILLQYLPPDGIPWTEVLGHPRVRLIVPLRVIEELDAKKYAPRRDLADRARRILPTLESAVGRDGAPRELRAGVTIEVPVDAVPRGRPEDADEEILSVCHELQQLTGSDLTLVTADTALRLRAQAQGLRVLTLPAKYERPRPDVQTA
jgi:rRNA-processing protein FCF1